MTTGKRDMFKFAEKCLYEYKTNLAALEILRRDLQVSQCGTDVKAQSYLNVGRGSGVTNPVASRIEQIERIEDKISRLERWTAPITRLIADLQAPYVRGGSVKSEMLSLMELYYFGQNDTAIIMSTLHLSRQSMFNRRRELVKMLLGYMGAS